jgi:3-hydroxybutyryl-CoA dehydrogenase
VIEAATENYELKVKILKQLDALLAQDVIVATNTSSISITQLAAATSVPTSSSACISSTPCP